MADDVVIRLTLAVIVGISMGIIWSLRILYLMERRVARIEEHLESLVGKVFREEMKIERSMRKR